MRTRGVYPGLACRSNCGYGRCVVQERAYEQYRDEGASWLKDGRMRLIAALLRRHLPPTHDARELLDLGAGIGLNLEVLRAFGVVDALESNRIGLEALAANPHVRDVFAHALPQLLERRYDVIGAFDVIEHLPDDDDAVAWIDAHLKPGGLLVATVPRTRGCSPRTTSRSVTSAATPRRDCVASSVSACACGRAATS